MVDFRPFRAYRPKTNELARKICSPPFDVPDEATARALATSNPYSFLHVIRPEVDFPASSVSPTDLHLKAKTNLDHLLNTAFIQEKEPSYYLYRQTMNGVSQTGIVGCASVADYLSNSIKKHELTRKRKQEDRMQHILSVNANTGLVYLFYPEVSQLNQLISHITQLPPLYNLEVHDTPYSETHTVWRVPSEYTASLQEELKRIPHVYIADGHHRSAAAVEVAKLKNKEQGSKVSDPLEHNYFMAVLFATSELRIFEYNRMVEDLNGYSPSEFLSQLTPLFSVRRLSHGEKPRKKGVIHMYLDHQWYALTVKSSLLERLTPPIETLDVHILCRHVMRPLLNIKDLTVETRIRFIGGIWGLRPLEKAVDTGEMAVAFALYPPSLTELMAVADMNMPMPPKSTWFAPKLRSGLFVHLLS